MKKLCYVLPEYNELTSEHYYHLYEFLEDVACHFDVYLVVEKSVGHPDFKAIKNISTLKLRVLPLNFLERFFLFTYLRLKGCGRFYIHYSYSSAIAASLVTHLLGGKTLYWHCNLKKDFMVRWKLDWPVIKIKFLDDYPFLITLRLIDYLVTGAEFMKDYYAVNFGVPKEKIRIMPNWVNLQRFNLKRYARGRLRKEFRLGASTKIVLFVHWLSPRKGPQYIVRIAKEVISKVPEVVFLIAGEGPYKEKLGREIEEEGLQGVMRLMGGVPNQEIPKYYAISDLLIMPSEEEGFPRILIEAMAMGVPFVATDVGSVNEVTTDVQKAGIVPKGEIQAFADKVIELLKNDELRNELGREGLNRVEDFSKEKVTKIFSAHVVK